MNLTVILLEMIILFIKNGFRCGTKSSKLIIACTNEAFPSGTLDYAFRLFLRE